jgi:hypothetical protein
MEQQNEVTNEVTNDTPVTDVIAIIGGGRYHFTFKAPKTAISESEPSVLALKKAVGGQYRMACPLGTPPTVRDDLAVMYEDEDGELHIQVDHEGDHYKFSFCTWPSKAGQLVHDCFAERVQEILTERIEVRIRRWKVTWAVNYKHRDIKYFNSEEEAMNYCIQQTRGMDFTRYGWNWISSNELYSIDTVD